MGEEPTYETGQERTERLKREQKERKKESTLQAKAMKKMREQKAYEDEMQAKFAKLNGMIKKGSDLA
ncbi:MAG: hypothetical protein AB8G05_01515 [Oligoflexales bacterium]